MVLTTRRAAGSIFVTVPSPEFATQTAPSPTAMPLGPLPTGIVACECVVRSIRVTVSSERSATQMAPSPTASPLGYPPTFWYPNALTVVGRMRETVLSREFAIQTFPAPNAIAVGAPPASPVSRTVAVAGSTRPTVELPYTAQTEPSPVVTEPPAAGLATLIVRTT